MTTLKEVGSVLGASKNAQESVKSRIQKRGVTTTYFLFADFIVQIYYFKLQIDYRDLEDYFVVGHSINSSVGDYKVGSPSGGYSTALETFIPTPVTIDFREEVAKKINGESATGPTHLAIGTGTDSLDVTDSTLGSESGDRTDIEETLRTNYAKTIGYFQDRDDQNITELGVFNASSGGTMVVRYVFDEIDFSKSNEYKIELRSRMLGRSIGETRINDYNFFENFLINTDDTAPSHIGWSDGTGSLSSSDTDLDGSNKQRNALKTYTNSRPTNPGYKVKFLGVLTSAQLNSVTVTKSGLFTGASGSNLFCEIRHSDISKTSLFKIQEQVSITVVSI